MATKESKEHYILPIFIGLLIIIVFGGLFGVTLNDINKSMNERIYMNKIIESNTKKDGIKAYLTITSITPKFAEYKKNGYYFVSDGSYNYIVLMDEKTAEELMNQDLEKNPVTIEGVSREMPEKLKEIALDSYNLGITEDEKISTTDYYSYFGDIYLDQTLALK